MTDSSEGTQNISVSVPMGVIAAGALVGLAAAAAYVLSSRDEADPSSTVKEKAKSGRGLMRKFGLLTLITLIENDATRKAVVAVLRAMARRA